MQQMYPGMPNSPQTELAADITAEDTTIPLLNASVLPDPPNICTIGTGEDAETVLYTGKSGNNLTGVTRGFQGAAKAWVQGTKVARNFTAYDYDALRQNVEEVAGEVATVQGDVSAIQSDVSAIRTDLGDMSTVPTTSKVVAGAISELFQSVSDGKTLIAGAITDKGVPTSPSDTFAQMAANIEAIETGGPWFGDWSAYTPVYDISGTTVNIPAKSWHTFVDVEGEGFLKWCRAYPFSNGMTKIKLTIDGTEKIFDTSTLPTRVGNEILENIPFSVSLKIEAYNSENFSQNVGLDYLYFIENTPPNPNTKTILNQSVITSVFFNNLATVLTDIVNLAGSGYLLGIEFFAMYSASTAGTIFGDIIIDGVQKMSDRQLFNISSSGLKLSRFYGPIRFNSSLRVRTRSDNAGTEPVCIVRYSLD